MNPRPRDSTLLARAARPALALVPLVMAAVLVLTLLAHERSVRGMRSTLERGQGMTLIGAVRRATRPGWRESDVADLLAEQSALGLRCIAVFHPGLELRVAAGCKHEPAELEEILRSLRPGEVVRLPDGLLRTAQIPPLPPRPERDGPPRWEDDGPLRPRPGGRRRPPGEPRDGRFDGPLDRPFDGPRDEPPVAMPMPVLIEYAPVLTDTLAAGARRTLGIGAAVALVLVVVAALLWRVTVREERGRERRERDRRLAALGEMSAVLAHEIRNPLASLKGHAQLLAERLPAEGREREKADRLVHEAVRLERLTDDLLRFVRSPQLERAMVDPRALLRRAAETVAPGQVELSVDGAPATWSLDGARMEEVLANLLRNAVEASPGHVMASLAVEGGRLVFAVRDFGAGIDPEARGQLFEPFYTTRVRGTGLGLAVSRRIVELHGGELAADNHPQGGAVFRAAIPPAGERREPAWRAS